MSDLGEVARADQIDAAMADASAALGRMAGSAHAPLAGRTEKADTYPGWMWRYFERSDAVMASGGGDGCEHWQGVPVRVMAVSRPARITCGRCVPLLAPADPVDESRCDACGGLFPPLPGRVQPRLRSFMVSVAHPSLGAVILMASLCHGCHDASCDEVGVARSGAPGPS